MTILKILRDLYDDRGDEIEQWFAAKRKQAEPFFYTSVDLRHSGLRLVPVDTNLYPAGFNNMSQAARSRASRYVARFLAEQHPNAKNILIVPENHTRNLGYLENLAVLSDILSASGCDVRIGSLASEDRLELQSLSGRTIVEVPIKREGDLLKLVDGFTPDVVILNNDMTAGAHPLLEGVLQPVLPPMEMGWYRRRKSVHFECYETLVQDFCKQFSLDPWLLSAGYYRCGMVDFKERTNLIRVAKSVDMVITKTRAKYAEYGITDEPYVYVKADSGTYGMGIMTVRSGEEMFELNKKERNKMQVIKEGTVNSEVIIQEGIPTIDRVDGSPAEPMVYMIDGLPAGGMYRVNANRDGLGNLNAAGMEFVGMCDESETADIDRKSVKECDFRAYGLVAAIAALASARENYESYMLYL